MLVGVLVFELGCHYNLVTYPVTVNSDDRVPVNWKHPFLLIHCLRLSPDMPFDLKLCKKRYKTPPYGHIVLTSNVKLCNFCI